MNQAVDKKPCVSVAPMMDWTDRHYRYFARLLSPNIELYTEMVTTGALLHGDRARHLRYSTMEHPVALQLGGSDADALAECAKMGADHGYGEINLNCGCPSDRVQSGRFGACLMKEPDHVATCVEAMMKAVDIPVTVKCRIGIDDQDDQKSLDEFVSKIADKGCTTFIVHARKAWLKGLSPKENRDVPPLDYERVAAVKAKYPHLRIILNGGIKTVDEVRAHLKIFDGVMIGREAYSNPYLLAELEREIFGAEDVTARESAARAMINYTKIQQELYDTPIKSITRHIIGLYHEQPGAKAWRRALSTLPHEKHARAELIEEALEMREESAKQSLINAA